MSSNVEIIRMLHVSLPVQDIGRARQFYEGVLGLEVSPARPQLGFDGAWYDIGAQQIHLLATVPQAQAPLALPAGRDRHVAFAVANLDRLIAALEQHQIAFTRSASGRRALFCRDPDGNALEFSELVES